MERPDNATTRRQNAAEARKKRKHILKLKKKNNATLTKEATILGDESESWQELNYDHIWFAVHLSKLMNYTFWLHREKEVCVNPETRFQIWE